MLGKPQGLWQLAWVSLQNNNLWSLRTEMQPSNSHTEFVLTFGDPKLNSEHPLTRKARSQRMESWSSSRWLPQEWPGGYRHSTSISWGMTRIVAAVLTQGSETEKKTRTVQNCTLYVEREHKSVLNIKFWFAPGNKNKKIVYSMRIFWTGIWIWGIWRHFLCRTWRASLWWWHHGWGKWTPLYWRSPICRSVYFQ